MIADFFRKLFGFLGGIFNSLINWFKDTFETLFDVIWDAIAWIGRLIKKMFQGLVDILVAFFEVIYDLIRGLLYLIYMIGVLAVKLFQVIFEAAKVLWSLIVGFGRTLASLSYTPRSGGGHGYSQMIGKIINALDVMQLDVIAYILLFILWFVTAISAIKLISSIRVGGD